MNKINHMLEAATIAYANANNSLLPQDPFANHGSLPELIDPSRVQKFLARRPPNVKTLQELKGYQRLVRGG